MAMYQIQQLSKAHCSKAHCSKAHYTEPLEGLGKNVSLQMRLIPAGTFTMGSLEDEPEHPFKQTQREVTLSAFFLGRYPVTQAQWQAVVDLPQVHQTLQPDPSYFKGANRPVEQVSWYEAVEFCDRLAAHTGRPYRLPSEAEWEYACRAGTTTPFYFGKTITTEFANYKGSYNGTPDYQHCFEEDDRKTTTPVDRFEVANAFDLLDMHGNVWEWCQDKWSYSGSRPAPANGSDLNSDRTERILRGGSWASYPRRCRSECRLSRPSGERDFRDGFRLCCSAPKTLAV